MSVVISKRARVFAVHGSFSVHKMIERVSPLGVADARLVHSALQVSSPARWVWWLARARVCDMHRVRHRKREQVQIAGSVLRAVVSRERVARLGDGCPVARRNLGHCTPGLGLPLCMCAVEIRVYAHRSLVVSFILGQTLGPIGRGRRRLFAFARRHVCPFA